jgi:hypothetical protein
MQQQAIESVWIQLSPMLQQTFIISFQQLCKCSNDVEERRRVLALIEFFVVLENRTLKNSEQFNRFMLEISRAAIQHQVGLINWVGKTEIDVGEAEGIKEDATE